ncbi:MAG: acyltransferase family protein [Gordonia polyisoprenivorans]|nr:acyltransferase family protein [Gordonia polyisoprenivorans]
MSTPTTRQLWPDLARAACIVLVVLWHVTSKSLAQLTDGPVVTAYEDVCAVLQPIRIPLFFTISGLFAASAIARPWAQTWRRPATSYWLYVVWVLIQTAIFLVLPLATNSADSPKHLAYALALGYTSL